MFRPAKRQRQSADYCPSSILDVESLQTAIPVVLPTNYYNNHHPQNHGSIDNDWNDPSSASGNSTYVTTTLRPTLVSTPTKALVLERLAKEVIHRFHYTPFSSQVQLSSDNTESAKQSQSSLLQDALERRSILRDRILIGTNSTLRLLEQAIVERTESSGAVPNGPHHRVPLLLVVATGERPRKTGRIILSEGGWSSTLAPIALLAHQLHVPVMWLPDEERHASTSSSSSSLTESTCRQLGQLLGIPKASVMAFLPIHQNNHCSENGSVVHRALDSFVQFVVAKVPR